MKKLIFPLVLLGLAALAFKFLPFNTAATLVGIFIAPYFLLRAVFWFFGWIFRSALGDMVPKKTRKTLRAGQTFQGSVFTFTLPVRAEVEQFVMEGLEALLIKPRLELPRGKAPETILLASTMSQDEVKSKVNQKLDDAFEQYPQIMVQEPAPVEVGALTGERRMLSAEKDGKSVRGEAVYLGDATYSIAWAVIAESDAFEAMSNQLRELAVLIKRNEGAVPKKASRR